MSDLDALFTRARAGDLIAAFLEIPVTTVKKRLYDARKRLRERMAEIKSLKNVVAFAHNRRYRAEEACYRVDAVGFAAYELWREAFRSGEVDVRFAPGHADILCWLRKKAAEYLWEIADLFPEASKQALLEAADAYRLEVGEVEKLAITCRRAAEDNGFTTSSANEAANALDAALDAERKAVGQIENALAALPETG